MSLTSLFCVALLIIIAAIKFIKRLFKDVDDEDVVNRIQFDCSKLCSIKVPKHITEIKDDTFLNPEDIGFVKIHQSVVKISDAAFRNLYSLRKIKVDYDNCNFESDSGILYSRGREKLLKFPSNKEWNKFTIYDNVKTISDYSFYHCKYIREIYIKSGVKSIGNHAFPDCQLLRKVEIGNDVETIGDFAFYNCDFLENIILGQSIKTIGESAFRYCELLTSVIVPDFVEEVGNHAFAGCIWLTSIVIGNSVVKIGRGAFGECVELKNIYISTKRPPKVIGDNIEDCDVFNENVFETAQLFVLPGCKKVYRADGLWGRFHNIHELDFLPEDKNKLVEIKMPKEYKKYRMKLVRNRDWGDDGD